MAYFQVTIFNIPSKVAADELQSLAMREHGSLGIEEFSLDEPAVDALLGERSYSGGDLPPEVIDEVDQAVNLAGRHFKFYFAGADERRARAFEAQARSRTLCEASVERFEDEDWNTEWKKHYSPISVSDDFVVLPEWVPAASASARTVVRIYPGMGFGTGSHETTFLCLALFLRFVPALGQHASVLDYGSGSGILGIGALRTNPGSQCVFVDIDHLAHENCQKNLALNDVAPSRVRFLYPHNRPEAQRFPLVFANILQNILHDECAYLCAATEAGGHLILSGLLASQAEETRDFYLQQGSVELVAHETKGDWAALVLRKLR